MQFSKKQLRKSCPHKVQLAGVLWWQGRPRTPPALQRGAVRLVLPAAPDCIQANQAEHRYIARKQIRLSSKMKVSIDLHTTMQYCVSYVQSPRKHKIHGTE